MTVSTEIKVESRNLFKDYSVEFVRVEDFRAFYEKENNFNSYSEKKFLSSVKIPPQYSRRYLNTINKPA